jgi:hypothetical protein
VSEQGTRAHKLAGPIRDRDWPLRILAHREAGNAKVGRLFLQSAGIGDDQFRTGHDVHEIDIGQGVEQHETLRVRQPFIMAVPFEALDRARVSDEHGPYAFRNL